MGIILDISHHQPSSRIDWAKAAKEVSLVIIRVQYGSSTIDREYKNHVANCKKYGIPFAHYAYGRYVSVKDAVVEATDFYNRGDKDAKFWVLDCEKDTVASCGTGNLAAASQAFLDYLKGKGVKTGFYVSHELYKQYGLNGVKADFLWIPRYGADNGTLSKKPDFPCDLWQYSQNCKSSFYASGLDMSVINGSKSLEWFIGGQPAVVVESKPAPVAPKPAAPKPAAPKVQTYKIQSGDTLSKIAIKLGVSQDVLQKANGIANPNKIYAGQVLKVPGASAPAPKPAAPTKKYHKVVSGDTVSELAAKYGSSLAQIKAWNGLDSRYTIRIGQTLRVK